MFEQEDVSLELYLVVTCTLCVFYLLQVVAGADVMLPGDEIWLCDLDSGTW